MEYGNVIWSPYLNRQSVTIERVQRRATRLLSTLGDLNYTERLKKLDLPKYRRFRGDLIQVHKIINQIGDLKFDTFCTPTKLDITRNTDYKFYVEYSKTHVRKFTFSNRIVPAWSVLSLITKSAPNINKFKNLLDKRPKWVSKYDCDS